MRHQFKGSRGVLCSLAAVLLLSNSGFARAQGNSGGTCVATGEEAVTPEKLNFSPGNVASYSGSGFAPSCGVRANFSGPGGAAPGRIVNTDRWGNLSFTNGLGSASGHYRADLTGKGGAALDSVTVTAGTLDAPSAPVGATPFIGNFGTADHGSGFSSSLIIPNNGTTTGAPVGSTVIVAFSSGPANGGGPVSSCADTQNNTYTVDVNLPTGSNARGLAICSAHIGIALGAADAITVHFPTNGNSQHATANVFGGLVPVPLDKTSTASGTSNAPSSGSTATTSQAREVLVGAFAFNGTNFNTFSAGANFALTNASQGAGTNTGLGSEYRVVSSTGAYSADGSLSVATAWLGAIATYKTTAPPVISFVAPTPPEGSVTGRSVTLKFSASDPTATYTCQLDTGAQAACSAGGSGIPYSSLSGGQHTLTVVGTDLFGNTGSVIRTWFVDAVGPTIQIQGPANGSTIGPSGSITFTSNDPTATYTCQQDSDALVPCNPFGFSYNFSTTGQHTLTVVGTDPFGNTGSDSRTWTISD